MNWSSIILIIVWAVLAIANIAGIWAYIPLLAGIFGLFNCGIIVSLIPQIVTEIKIKMIEKSLEKEKRK